MMSLVTAEAVVPLAVKSLYNRRFVRLAERHGSILIVQSLGAYSLQVNGCRGRTGAEWADRRRLHSRGASHDLDKRPVRLAASDLLHDLVRGISAGSNGNLDGHAGNIDGGFLDGVGPADGSEVDIKVVLAR